MSRTYYIRTFMFEDESGSIIGRRPYFLSADLPPYYQDYYLYLRSSPIHEGASDYTRKKYVVIPAHETSGEVAGYIDYSTTYTLDLEDADVYYNNPFKVRLAYVDPGDGAAPATYLAIHEYGLAVGSSEGALTSFFTSRWNTGGWSPTNYSTFKSNCITWAENNLPASWTSVNLVIYYGDHAQGSEKIHVPIIYEGNDPNADEIITI